MTNRWKGSKGMQKGTMRDLPKAIHKGNFQAGNGIVSACTLLFIYNYYCCFP